jgi:gamma-glutamyltranspeptidase
MTIYNATTKRCHVIDAREVAPAKAFERMYVDRWSESREGWRAVAVPGELHGLWTEFKQFGSGAMAWRDLVRPTIDLLAEGDIYNSIIISYRLSDNERPRQSFHCEKELD